MKRDPAGLGRRLMTGVGLLTLASLILEHGLEFGPAVLGFLHWLESGLALCYVIDRVLLLWHEPRRLEVLRYGRYEYALLLVCIVLGISLILSHEWAMRLVGFLHLSASEDLFLGLLQLFLVGNVLIQILRLQQHILARRIRPEWTLIGSFALVVVVGSLLLLLPKACAVPEKPIRLVDALFTATSATCVTGLSVRDTGSAFSLFGQVVIMALIQVGGLGIVTFVAFLALTTSDSLPIIHRHIFRYAMSTRSMGDLKRHVGVVILFTALIELIGAACMYIFLPAHMDPLRRAFWSVFHSISAFCNAGFALQRNNLMNFQTQGGMMVTFMGLIILGGLGFLVVADLISIRVTRLPIIRRVPAVRRFNEQVPVYRLPLQTRLSLIVTAALLVLGVAGFWWLESGYLLQNKSVLARFWISAFQSVTCRTAGFNTVPMDQLQPATMVLLMGLMAVGACPVSTGGGIKTVTLGVLVLALRTVVRGRERVEVFGRALPQKVIFTALSIALLYVTTASVGTFALACFDPKIPLPNQAFEVISALSTVGLSTGITPQLSTGSKLVLCIAMFVGRVGPISLVLSVFQSSAKGRYQYPEEDLVVG
ncbi:MAG: hypothetical protein M1608_11290 [Candidatus Omnitrophica bacterium]|nr:hypothetical protein [Candidatus Omnitrophota bacterium]